MHKDDVIQAEYTYPSILIYLHFLVSCAHAAGLHRQAHSVPPVTVLSMSGGGKDAPAAARLQYLTSLGRESHALSASVKTQLQTALDL